MSDFGTDYRLAKLHYRRVCTVDGALVVARIQAEIDKLGGRHFEETLVTGHSFEGGSGQAQQKFDIKAAALVLEELMLEADTSIPREVTQTQATFRTSTTTTA